jgi:AraC-like DNA-binding protein
MIDVLNNFAFAQLLMCGLLLLPYRNKGSSIVLFILLMLSSACYLLSAVITDANSNIILNTLGFIGGNALPGIFWLVSLKIFGDHHELEHKYYYLASLTLLIPLLANLLLWAGSFEFSTAASIKSSTKYLGLVIELTMICHALYISASNWRNDLVLERRYIRGGVISLSGLYILVVILAEQIFKIENEVLELIKALGVVALTSGINLILFKPKSSTLFESKVVKGKVEPTSEESKLLEALITSMTVDKLYKEDGLTLSALAKSLSTPDYKLRNLINRELNYRNFNDFLNKYRIDEISSRIKSDPESSTPFLTLALESGFRSLSSFNKAFKQTHQQTPTEYRKKHLTDY